MLTLDDINEMARIDMEYKEHGECPATLLNPLIARFNDDLLEQLSKQTLVKNAYYSQFIDHPLGFSFYIRESGDCGVFTCLYEGDVAEIYRAGCCCMFDLPLENPVMREKLKPFFRQPSPYNGDQFVKWCTPPNKRSTPISFEKAYMFFEEIYPKIDWDTYGWSADNPILLDSVSSAYKYLRALLARGSSICFTREGSILSQQHGQIVDGWKVYYFDGTEMVTNYLFTCSYAPVNLLPIPPKGFRMNPALFPTIDPRKELAELGVTAVHDNVSAPKRYEMKLMQMKEELRKRCEFTLKPAEDGKENSTEYNGAVFIGMIKDGERKTYASHKEFKEEFDKAYLAHLKRGRKAKNV